MKMGIIISVWKRELRQLSIAYLGLLICLYVQAADVPSGDPDMTANDFEFGNAMLKSEP